MTFHRASLALLYLLTLLMVAYLVATAGGYYLLGETDRPLHELHEGYKPAGLIGHGLGIIGSLLMIVLLLYSIRKRARWAQKWGNIRYWLNYHIWMGVTGPLLVIFHTSFKLGGIVAVSFWSMIGVALSGVVGRYIYIQIPRSREGHQLTANELVQMDADMRLQLVSLGVSEEALAKLQESEEGEGRKGWGSIIDWLTADVTLPFKMGRIKRILLRDTSLEKQHIHEVTALLRQKLLLHRRIRFLQTAESLMHYWHVIHKPFAVVMLVIMVIHVTVAVLFGYTWIFKIGEPG